MSHEEHGTLLCILLEVVVEDNSQCLGVFLSVHKWHTELQHVLARVALFVKLKLLHVVVVEVAVDVVAEVFHCINHAAEFLTRNDLHRLYDNLLILYTAKCLEPVLWFVEVALCCVLACCCTVDADC